MWLSVLLAVLLAMSSPDGQEEVVRHHSQRTAAPTGIAVVWSAPMLDAVGISPGLHAANICGRKIQLPTAVPRLQRQRPSRSPLAVTSEGQLSPPEPTAKVTVAQMMPNRMTTAAIASHRAMGGLID